MALLHYQKFGEDRPDVLMGKSVRSLQVFYDFLRRTKSFMESDASVKRLAWNFGNCPVEEDDENQDRQIWIELTEPEDRPNESEAVFRMFLDENAKKVYETKPVVDTERTAQGLNHQLQFSSRDSIRILDRHPQTQQLCLERLPAEGTQLALRPNTWPVQCQIRAVQALQNEPSLHHRPLLRLFESTYHARWQDVIPTPINEHDWMVLTEKNRDGTDEQRLFVETALGTPDFALLEGPPGSGKTTAICELILQLAKQGKRILLCGSTHIAVDNVLERLMDEDNPHSDSVIPVRIGDKRLVSEKARPWQIEVFVKTERNRILKKLDRIRNRTPSQDELRSLLQYGDTVIERMVLEVANLVCGTTIGILQHPHIRARKSERRQGIDPNFDVLIIDEASKTPFQEFLVPALWAKRWIIVGDPKQLSPYVDDEAMAVNIEACLPDEDMRNACIDTFLAASSYKPQVTAVATTSEKTKHAYKAQCDSLKVTIGDVDQENCTDLWVASIVIGERENLLKSADRLPLDITTVRTSNESLPLIQRRAEAWKHLSAQTWREQPKWASEVGWRSARLYELRLTRKSKTQGDKMGISEIQRKSKAEKYQEDIEKLLPNSADEANRKQVLKDIARVRRVAIPSILESLQNGFERDERQKHGSALSDGMPYRDLEKRYVLLSTQHRMHPEIAEFSHNHIYDSKALRTPECMEQERLWNYSGYRYRSIWINVPARGSFRNNRNSAEAHQVVNELSRFDEWAKTNPRDRNAAWEVAVLTFYRGQEREIRDQLRNWASSNSMRHFQRGPTKCPYMTIELCTVDRFQGHEADFVLISFVNRRPTSFLESPNRLNVALTRARYQRVIIGDRKAMERGDSDGVLHKLAKNEQWEEPIKVRKR